jgi:hypothetical protein
MGVSSLRLRPRFGGVFFAPKVSAVPARKEARAADGRLESLPGAAR